MLAGLCLFLTWPVTGTAVVIGNPQVRSHLDQPLQIDIPLTGVSAKAADQLKVQLAPESAFASFGYEFTPALQKFRFAVLAGSARSATLRITTKDPVSEPFLAFMLSIRYDSAQLVRGFTILLDPLEYPDRLARTRAIPLPPQPIPITRPSPVTVAPPRTPSDQAGVYGPVVEGQSLWRIARRLHGQYGVTISQMMWSLFQANPDAFFDNNANALKTGVELVIPEPKVMARVPDQAAAQRLTERTVPVPTQEAEAPSIDAAPATDRPVISQSISSDLEFDLAPRFQFSRSWSEGETPEPVPGTQLGQLLDPTAKLALATDSPGPDEQLSGEAETNTGAATVSEQADRGDTQRVDQLLEIRRLERQITTLQDQLADRDEQISSFEQKLADINASMKRAVSQINKGTTLLSPLNILLGLLVLVVTLMLGWLLAQRRRQTSELRDDVVRERTYSRPAASMRESAIDESSFETLAAPPPADYASTADNPEPAMDLEIEPLPVGTEFLTGELRDSEAGMRVSETSVQDELDSYINGGYYNDAKNLLLRLTDKEPNKIEYRMQLLRVLRILGEGDEFVRQAKLTRSAIVDPDGAIWEDIRRMGIEIRPNEPLFSEDYFAIADDDQDEEDNLVEFKP